MRCCGFLRAPSTYRLAFLLTLYGGIDDEHRKKIIDEHKDDQLDKQKEGKNHYKEELGSNSEAAVCTELTENTALWGLM